MKLPKSTNLPGQIGRGLFLISCMGLAGVSAALGMIYAHALDWTMMGIGMLCLTPVLIVLDVATMAVLAWSSVQTRRLREVTDGPEMAPQDAKAVLKETQLVRLTSLALVHLVTAGLAVFLLTVPASSIWSAGLTLPRLRVSFLALSALSLLMALELPYTMVNALLPLVKGKKEEDFSFRKND